MQRQLARVVVQQVLAVRLGAVQDGAAQAGRALGEAPLRAVGVHLVAREQLGVPGGEAVDAVSLWHNGQA